MPELARWLSTRSRIGRLTTGSMGFGRVADSARVRLNDRDLGVLIGPRVLGLVHESEILHALAEIGVVILLFEIGLESDLGELLRAGLQSTVVAFIGVACPFALGYGLAMGDSWKSTVKDRQASVLSAAVIRE